MSTRLGSSKVIDVLDAGSDDTLVLLDGVLCLLLLLLAGLLLDLGFLFSLLLETLSLGLSLGLLFSLFLRSEFLLDLFLVLLSILLLSELLDTFITSQAVVDQFSQSSSVFGLALLAGIRVFLLNVSLVITAFVVIWNILIEILKCTPRVEVVPEIVKVINLLLGAVIIAELRNRLLVAESCFALEDCAPFLVECGWLGHFFLGGRVNISGLVDAIELSALDRIGEDFMSLLNALEEAVVFFNASSGFLVRMVLENLSAVGFLDLLLRCFVAVLAEAQDSVVILALCG